MANSRLSLAMMAGLNQRALLAAFASGRLSKSDFRTIVGLRANGGAVDVIAKHVGDKVLRDRKLRKVGNVIAKYATQRVKEVQKKEKPMSLTDITARNVEKAAETQRTLREAIHEYQKNHPGCNREDAIDKVLFSRPVADLHKRDLEEVAKLGVTKPRQLPQRQSTDSIDFGSPGLVDAPGYDSGKDVRRPGRAHASGGPQSGEEDQPVLEDHNTIMDRLIKAGMARGLSFAKATNEAADSQEFKDAFKAWKAKHGY